MANVMTIVVNGERRELAELSDAPLLVEVVAALELKADRIAVERNGNIVRRADWGSARIADGDRLEIVHFVGGGRA